MIDFLRPRTALRATDETDAGAFAAESANRRPRMRAGRTEPLSLGVAAQGTIGLLEHCGSGNLGDDATVAAALQQIARRWPEVKVIGLSLDPSDSARRHGIPSYPIRRDVSGIKEQYTTTPAAGGAKGFKAKLKSFVRGHRFIYSCARLIVRFADATPVRVLQEAAFLAKSARVTSKLDILIVCGGGQLLDAWGGPWQFPYTILKWVVLARLSGAKCYFLNVGAGPLDHSLSKKMIKASLRLAEYVSFRDAESKALVENIGYTAPSAVVADNVYALQPPAVECGSRRIEDGAELTIGIAPMAYCDPSRYWRKDEAVYKRLISKLADFGAQLLRDGYRLRLLTTDIWFDSQALIDLENAIRSEVGPASASMVIREPVDDLDGYLTQLSQVDCLVTCKFHGVIFAHLLEVPVLALAHHPKVSTAMREFDMSEYCLDIETFQVEQLTTTFELLIENRRGIAARMRRKVTQYRKTLAAQYDELFSRRPPRGSIS